MSAVAILSRNALLTRVTNFFSDINRKYRHLKSFKSNTSTSAFSNKWAA
jgi:hypothetical protein